MRTIPLFRERPLRARVIVTAIFGMLRGALGGRLRRVVVKPPAEPPGAAAEADPGT